MKREPGRVKRYWQFLLLGFLLYTLPFTIYPSRFYGYEKTTVFIPAISKSVDVVADELLVRLRDGVSAAAINARYGTAVIQDMKFNNVFRFSIPSGSNLRDMLNRISADHDVIYAEPNSLRTIYQTNQTNDPLYSSQWALQNINWYDAWKSSNTLFTGGAPTSVIAVIDSGIDLFHPDLEANIFINTKEIPNNGIDDDNNGYIDDYYGVNILYGQDPPKSAYEHEYADPRPIDTVGHGTHVSGIAAACVSNSTGIAGVSWKSKIMPVKVLDATGSGTDSNIAAGIKYAADNGADVLNLSLGGPLESRFLKDAVDYALSKNVVIVAAAGNEGINSISYPAGYSGVISVGASDINDKRTVFSNYGIKLDLLAPGDNIYSTYRKYTWSTTENDWTAPEVYYSTMSGTSMSSPFVAGLCGLIVSQNSTRLPSDVEKILEASCDDLDVPGWDKYTGWGRINVKRALSGNFSKMWVAPPKLKSYPNPFEPRKNEFVTIRLSEQYKGSEFKVTIYNLSALPVRHLKYATNEISVDNGIALWDGKNDNGDMVASGLYYYAVDIGSQRIRGKITLIK